MKLSKIREILKYYDSGILTEHEVEVWIEREFLEEKTTSLKHPKSMLISFIAGAFSGPLHHHYGMYDVTSQCNVWYPFTLPNVLRFYWNKLMRRIGWHRLTKVR